MKKLLILLSAVIIAVISTEVIVAQGIGYPAYGVEYKVAYRIGASTWTNVRKSHAKLYNVEGKTLTWVNNYGLPGENLSSLDSLIVVLGSSYVEAFQYKPSGIASSLLKANLDSLGYKRNVMNLGCSGHDPYDSWFRLKYFEEKLGFRTEDVVLVLNSDNLSWFQRHPRPFVFAKPQNFGDKNSDPKVKALIAARNLSSLIEVFAKAMKGNERDDIESIKTVPPPPRFGYCELNQSYSLSDEMVACLTAYSADYDRFKVVSTAGESEFNDALEGFCADRDIELIIMPLSKTQFKIGGSGHLNRDGNHALANALTNLYHSTNNIQIQLR